MKKITLLFLNICFSGLLIAQQNPVFKKADSLFNAQNYNGAKTEYEKLLKENNGSPLTWNRLGFSCYNLGQFDEAIVHFNKSLSLNPAAGLKPIVLIRLAKSHGAKKDKANALTFLKNAAEGGYQNWDDVANDPNLQLIKAEPQMAKIKEVIILNGSPCMKDSKWREFDFWIGSWNVFDASGKPVGENIIQLASAGCALLENWSSTNGTSTAKSLTYLNSETGKWEQLYIDNTGNQIKFTDGEFKNDVMKFSVAMKGPDGKMNTGRFVFEKKPNGEVRQYQEMSSDEGNTWSIWFDLIYKLKR